MTIEFERHNDSTTIANLEGRIDSANSQEFQSALESGLDTGASLVVLDFERVTIISSAGLRVVLFLAKHLKSRGAKIALCTLSTQIREVMAISGFDRILPIFSSRAEAVGSPAAADDPVQKLRLPTEFSLSDVADNVKDIALLTIEQYEFVNEQTLSDDARERALSRIEEALSNHVKELKRRRMKILRDMFALAAKTLEESL